MDFSAKKLNKSYRTSTLKGDLDHDVVEKIADYFRDHSGWKINERDWKKLESSIRERMMHLNIHNIDLYFQKLVVSSHTLNEEFFHLAALLANNETYFFRDQGQYEVLRTDVLPELIERKRKIKQLRIWSAGCASGEEIYSIAIILTTLLRDINLWKITLIGSDISAIAIQKAREALYRENSLRNVKPLEKNIYFTKFGNEWQLNDRYRSMVKFFKGNLLDDPFPSMVSEFNHMDLIICRNVFIYFQPSAIEKVLEKFERTLDSKGILVLGHGEASSHNLHNFETQVFSETMIYRKKNGH